MMGMGLQERKAAIGYAAAVIGLLVVIAAGARWSEREVAFCRGLLWDLAHARPSADGRIDWQHLTAMGTDVGAVYKILPDDKARAKYRATFIKGFAEGFRRVNARTSAFARWRVYKRGPAHVIVAADDTTHHKTLLFQISATGRRRLESIQWEPAHGRM